LAQPNPPCRQKTRRHSIPSVAPCTMGAASNNELEWALFRRRLANLSRALIRLGVVVYGRINAILVSCHIPADDVRRVFFLGGEVSGLGLPD
jgi:hypothetical protein